MFSAWGYFVYRRRWIVLFVSTIFLAGSLAVLAQGARLTPGGPVKASESGRAFTLLQDELPRAGGSSMSLIFQSDTLPATDAKFREALEAAVADLRTDPRVESVRTPYDTTPPVASLISNDGRKAIAIVTTNDDLATAVKYYPSLRAKVAPSTLAVTATGFLAINHDFNEFLEADLRRAERVSLPLALFLLLIVFGTVVAALLPLGVGGFAVIGGLAGMYLLARVVDVSVYAQNIVTLIGLGVAIDYSLFVVMRFREELARFDGRGVPGSGARAEEIALARALSTAGRTITFSGLTVIIGLSGMLFFDGTYLSSMGLSGAIVVGASVLYGLTFLPALLAIIGRRVEWLRIPLGRGPASGPGMWHGLANWVMRRPLLVLVPVLAVILLTASPFLQLRMATSDVTALPKSAESRRGYDSLVGEFPGWDQTRISVVVRTASGDPLVPDRVAGLVELSRRLAALPDVLRVESVVDLDLKLGAAEYQALYASPRKVLPPPVQLALKQSVGKHVVVFAVLTARAASSDEAQAIVRAIRTLPRPTDAVEVMVTGQTAFDIDVVAFIVERSKPAILWIMFATYVVLFLLLGSVILPLKAVIMNLLSIATSFGALIWIFQQGHLSEILNFSAAPIDPTLPVMMFCIIFGLSMDYEVLLLSRMQEEYVRTRDNRRAVAEGLERSGRLITGAAAIMAGVFLAFALADVVLIKAIGLGMAIAVIIDATLVRALVVPATMRLLGDLNWWAPAPLARLYERLGLGDVGVVRRDAAAEGT
ncbi:MAG: MMPL family transporter [Chloroflexi bacterium]|nr:MMPL family transporter [Chloroflexota bacterium]